MDKIIPDMYQKSIYHIDYDKLYESGIRCLLFDLDNTCIPFKDDKPNKKLVDLFETLKDMEFKVIIFSNSGKKRLTPFKKMLNVDCLASACKPFKKNYLKILKMFDYNLSEVAIIGDQLYTDILGGNSVGIKTILVNPMSKDDRLFTKLVNRPMENRTFKKMARKGLLVRGKYYE